MLSEVKAGDYLVCTSAQTWPVVLTKGKLYRVFKEHSGECALKTINNNNMDFFLSGNVSEDSTNLFRKATEQEVKRWKVKEACELLTKESVTVYNYVDGFAMTEYRKASTGAVYTTDIDKLLNDHYPIETPEQKELRELEEQQRKIADRMKELRSRV